MYAHIYTDSAKLVLKHAHLQHTATHCNATKRKRERLSLSLILISYPYLTVIRAVTLVAMFVRLGGIFFFCVCESLGIFLYFLCVEIKERLTLVIAPLLDLAAQKKKIYIHTNSKTLILVSSHRFFWFAATKNNMYTRIHKHTCMRCMCVYTYTQ